MKSRLISDWTWDLLKCCFFRGSHWLIKVNLCKTDRWSFTLFIGVSLFESHTIQCEVSHWHCRIWQWYTDKQQTVALYTPNQWRTNQSINNNLHNLQISVKYKFSSFHDQHFSFHLQSSKCDHENVDQHSFKSKIQQPFTRVRALGHDYSTVVFLRRKQG